MLTKNFFLRVLFGTLFIYVMISSYTRTMSSNLDFKVFHSAGLRLLEQNYDFYNSIRDQIFILHTV